MEKETANRSPCTGRSDPVGGSALPVDDAHDTLAQLPVAVVPTSLSPSSPRRAHQQQRLAISAAASAARDLSCRRHVD